MSKAQSIKSKIARLRKGYSPRVLDLFAGCGGLSLGFHTAGFELVAAVENDPLAALSHALNLFKSSPGDTEDPHAIARDITGVEPDELLSEIGIRSKPESAIDVIIGGPPCQAYARVGRAKLREVAEHPTAFLGDPRRNLYLRYLHYVKQLKPLALLMENVPDVMNHGGHNIADEICEVLDDLGYVCSYTLLNSSFYGVPQMRERMFLIAYRHELDVQVSFPKPTHWVKLPQGYTGSRDVALKVLRRNGFGTDRSLFDDEPTHFFQLAVEPSPDLQPAVTTEEALRDLPPITTHLEGTLRRGARRFDQIAAYRSDVPPTNYGTLMRDWPGFENTDGVYDHVIRSLPRDYQIFRRMNPGDQYPQAHKHAHDLCEEERIRRRIKKGTTEHKNLLAEIVPPYDPSKFPNKWRKLESFLPSRTLLAHIGKDTYSHIHYDSEQARTISVREAARLQSFPDGFIFSGTMNPAFRQVGNAVPPLLAYHLAVTMSAAMGVTPKLLPVLQPNSTKVARRRPK